MSTLLRTIDASVARTAAGLILLPPLSLLAFGGMGELFGFDVWPEDQPDVPLLNYVYIALFLGSLYLTFAPVRKGNEELAELD